MGDTLSKCPLDLLLCYGAKMLALLHYGLLKLITCFHRLSQIGWVEVLLLHWLRSLAYFACGLAICGVLRLDIVQELVVELWLFPRLSRLWCDWRLRYRGLHCPLLKRLHHSSVRHWIDFIIFKSIATAFLHFSKNVRDALLYILVRFHQVGCKQGVCHCSLIEILGNGACELVCSVHIDRD